MITNYHKNIATLLHISALSQYIFPFGNFIMPIILWSFKKDNDVFIDKTGKNVINFQLSLLLYTIIILIIGGPLFLYLWFHNHINFDRFSIEFNHIFDIHLENNWLIIGIFAIITFVFFKIFEFILIINGAIKAANGELYKYPFTISFFK